MIKSLIIENFQSHKKTKIDFTEGVNAVVGPSGFGKTVILRALLWLITNKPGGDEYRSWWGGDTKVTVMFMLRTGINFQVCREKTNSINKYILTRFNDQEEIIDEQEYTGFGVNVPDPIAQLINMTDVNLQAQLDNPFLLLDTPGEVARYLNRAVKLDDIDTGLSAIGSKYKTTNQSLSFEKNEQEEAERLIKQFDYLPSFHEDIEALEQMEKDKKESFQKMEKLSFLIGRIKKGEEWLQGAPPIKEIKQEIEAIIISNQALHELSKKADKLDDILSEISKQKEKIKESTLLKKAGEAIEVQLKKLPHLKEIQSNIIKLNNIISSVSLEENKIEEGQKELKIMKKEFNDIFPDICPLCGK